MFKYYVIKIKQQVLTFFSRAWKLIISLKQHTYKIGKHYMFTIKEFVKRKYIELKEVLNENPREGPNKESYPKKNDLENSIESKNMAQLIDHLVQEITIREKVIEDSLTVKRIILENSELQDIVKQIQYDKRQHFCTNAGTKYLIKVLTFFHSLERCSEDFKLFICCIDDFVYFVLKSMNLKNVVLIDVRNLETEELLTAKKNRSVSEYCWTLKPWLVSYLLNHYSIDAIIYCDSDLYFFSETTLIYKDWGEASLYLCPQRDVDWVEKKYGTYQAGLVGFKNNEIGKKAADWWKNKCLEWCYAKEDIKMGRWGDQKYLDQMPRLFADAKISGHLGINAAPWNTVYNNNFQISKKDSSVFIQEYPLVAYHFSCIDIFNKDQFDLWNLHGIKIPKVIKNKIYLPYLISLRKSIGIIENAIGKKINMCLTDKKVCEAKTFLKYSDFDVQVSKWDNMYYFCSIATSTYVFKIITLHRSLNTQMDNFHLWICCVDQQGYMILRELNLPHVTLIPLDEIENRELRRIKETRKKNEFCWTLKPILCSYLLNKYNIEKLLYCDADLYFFSHPQKVFEDWGSSAIYLSKQKAPSEMERLNGEYQAGLIGFSKNEYSFRALNWWLEHCLNWCFDTPEPENKRWGDQKYLDQLPLLFTFIKICEHRGINAAPWNLILNSNNTNEIKISDNKVFVDNDELVVYHFGSLLIFNDTEFDLWKWEQLNIDYRIMNRIYMPYLYDLRKSILKVKTLEYNIRSFFTDEGSLSGSKNYISLKDE